MELPKSTLLHKVSLPVLRVDRLLKVHLFPPKSANSSFPRLGRVQGVGEENDFSYPLRATSLRAPPCAASNSPSSPRVQDGELIQPNRLSLERKEGLLIV